MSSGSATPTSEPGTPTCDDEQIDEQTDPVLAETSIEQMQARLHAEFLQSVSLFLFIYLVRSWTSLYMDGTAIFDLPT